jgi:pimeloyl-ACP methyl ester carboxylesterase/DNA-binding SARP family transcriptional activator
VVAVPPLAQNIEVAWEWPEVRWMLERFGSMSRWVPFDKRGTGASDRRSRVQGIDERVDDLRAVMDDAGIERAFLYGSSEGGPMCLLFAATYPERVEGLILHGTGAYTINPDLEGEELEYVRGRIAWQCDLWGTAESPFVGGFAPSMADDEDFRLWHQRYERLAADRESLLELMHITLGVDVRDVLDDIDVPTLVMHRIDDPIVPIAWGREVAERVRCAEMIELPGRDHFPYAGDMSWMDDLERWLTGTVSERSTALKAQRAPRITTLGRFRVDVGGREVPTSSWGSKRARQLCKRLVVARGWPVMRDELFELLWPDESDTRRLGARLSVQLSAVRRVLGGGIIADRQTVALDLDHVSTDLEQLFRAADDEAVVAAYPGEFLPEDVYEDWSASVRDQARARFVAAARRLGASAAASSDYDRAAEVARRLIETDQYDEEAHRLLVEALVGGGEVREASRAHEAWTAALGEIGITVEPFEVSRFATAP